jgi:hypothetical protein
MDKFTFDVCENWTIEAKRLRPSRGALSEKPIQRSAMNENWNLGAREHFTLAHVLHRTVKDCHCTTYITQIINLIYLYIRAERAHG